MVLTSFEKTQKKIEKLKIKMTKFDLKNIKSLTNALHLKPEKFFTIHITGSNGKGSVAAFTTSILTQAGFCVGTYTSPHVLEITDRIKLNDKNISKKDFTRIAKKVFFCMKKNKIKASYFEFLTAMAFMYFQEKKVDFVVAEVGLGGRLDATNLLHGKINVFTSISLEHTKTLGNTIEKIAKEKAGIIKENSVTIIGEKNAGLAVVLNYAQKKKSRLVQVKAEPVKQQIEEQEFALKKPVKTNAFKTRLIGAHQVQNAGLALAAILELKKQGFKISNQAIRKGLLNAHNLGRLFVASKSPLIIFDAAHNLDGFKVLSKNLKMFEYDKLFLVFAVMEDKDWRQMLAQIKFDRLFLSKLNEDRALDPHKIKKVFLGAQVFQNTCSALKAAKKTAKKNDLVLVAGSIYAIGEALKCLKH